MVIVLYTTLLLLLSTSSNPSNKSHFFVYIAASSIYSFPTLLNYSLYVGDVKVAKIDKAIRK